MQRAGKIAGRLRTALDLLSNGTPVDVPESQLLEIVDEAGEQFKENLFKQLSQREREFKLRMSAFGRPLCQLQRDKANVKGAPRDYNFALRMMLGDAAEALIWALVRCAGLEVTGAKEPATLVLANYEIPGEDDIEIAHEVWDVKSSAPWTFKHKWRRGFDALLTSDTFGYVPQLYGYARARGLKPGGWIVVEKSSGEIEVVEASQDEDLIEEVLQAQRQKLDRLFDPEEDFVRSFEDEPEFYRGKGTGSRRLPVPCTFCDYLGHCWPEARYEPETLSKAQSPRFHWYSHYAEESERTG